MVTEEHIAERLEEMANDLRREEKDAQRQIEKKKKNKENYSYEAGLRAGYRSSIGRISAEINEILYA